MRIRESCRVLVQVVLLGAIFLACRHEQQLASEPPSGVADYVVGGLEVFVEREEGALRGAGQVDSYQWGRSHGSWAGFGKACVALFAHEEENVFVANLGARDSWAEHGALLLKLRIANNKMQIEDAAWYGSFDFSDALSLPVAEVAEGWIHYDDENPLSGPIALRAFFRGDMPDPIASYWMYSVSIPRIEEGMPSWSALGVGGF